ncbi:MAG TPA: methylated-DNA--[protein]-cysteine S-methyltransferase [Nocardioidaceae bacterium]|jgi:methylated-DNA-[protein]-cysteine S-methyltransferase|nr:methylated-DNA--[protein]-cysteine S-methyltransferase [Nocardioidaceae bacterium]
MTACWTTTTSPVGELLLAADEHGLTAVSFTPHAPVVGERDDEHPVLRAATRQLDEYFSRDRKSFELPLAPRGSAFRQQVWAALRDIPYGSTTTYGAIAGGLGLTGHGARAVGLANGANPLAIVVPCHRVVGSKGALTGYAGGLDRKRALLALEGAALF